MAEELGAAAALYGLGGAGAKKQDDGPPPRAAAAPKKEEPLNGPPPTAIASKERAPKEASADDPPRVPGQEEKEAVGEVRTQEDEVGLLVKSREKFRHDQEWSKADEVRDSLLELGYECMDAKDGATRIVPKEQEDDDEDDEEEEEDGDEEEKKKQKKAKKAKKETQKREIKEIKDACGKESLASIREKLPGRGRKKKPQLPYSMRVAKQQEAVQKKAAFTYVELFAGVGGFRMALDALGGRCVFASELSESSAATYAHNFGAEGLSVGDVRQVATEEIPGGFDILTAGFPCQSFTGIGERKGLEDDRGKLFYEVIRVLKAHRPRALLLENVKGLLTLDDGAVFRDEIEKSLVDLGYTVSHRLINSKLLLPQWRNRVYIVGVLNGGASFRFPPLPDLKSTARDILEPDTDPFLATFTLFDRDWEKVLNSRAARRYGLEHFVLALTDEEGGAPGGSRAAADTLISSYAKSLKSFAQFVPQSHLDVEEAVESKKFVLGKGANPRWFTPREFARLQGFPERFKTHPNKGRAYEQLGNAVCPPVVAAVAGGILHALGIEGDWEREGVRVALRLTLAATPLSKRAAILQRTITLDFGLEVQPSMDCEAVGGSSWLQPQNNVTAPYETPLTEKAFVGTVAEFLTDDSYRNWQQFHPKMGHLTPLPPKDDDKKQQQHRPAAAAEPGLLVVAAACSVAFILGALLTRARGH